MPAKAKQPEFLEFRMHPNLLHDVICRQAGTLSKAVLEGVMNSIDASATKVEIYSGDTRIMIKDDGVGIQNRQQIDDWFRMFGSPHAEEERKTYGTFRMGRGQLFAYGKNVWTTGKFRLTIDFKNCPVGHAGFSIEELPESEANQGTTISIELYEPLTHLDKSDLTNAIEHDCKFAPIPVFHNEERVDKDRGRQRWTHETEDFYVRFDTTQSLSVYNLGIHTLNVPKYRIGVGGVVVSKKQLKVNFARNDVQSDCAIWKKIRKLAAAAANDGADSKKSARFDDSDRAHWSNRIRNGTADYHQVSALKLLVTASGRKLPVDTLTHKGGVYHHVLGAAPAGDLLADQLLSGKTALILSQHCIEQFGCETIHGFMKTMHELVASSSHSNYRLDQLKKWKLIGDFEEFRQQVGDVVAKQIDRKEYTKKEAAWMDLLNYHNTGFGLRCRKVILIQSNSTASTTDGETYIGIERGMLDREFTAANVADVACLVISAYCHQTNIEETGCVFDEEYYRRFHEMVREGHYPEFVLNVIGSIPKVLARHKLKLNRARARGADMLDAIGDGVIDKGDDDLN